MPAALIDAASTKFRYQHAVVACARWEERYIVEWLNYYRAIGFDHVFLYCNDDDPTPLFALVEGMTIGAAPFVTFRHHAPQGQQREMYLDFLTNYGHLSAWFGFFDIDEFLRIPPGATIDSFLARFADDVGAVLFNWVFFGPNGHKTPPDMKVLEAFTRRQAYLHQNTKFLMRSAALVENVADYDQEGQPFWHRPNALVRSDYMICNALGEDARAYYEGFPDAPLAFINEEPRRAQIFETALIHHYAFRSEQAFAERAARGTLGSFAGQAMWKDLAEGDGFAGFLAAINQVEDLSLASFWQERRLFTEGAEERFCDLTSVDVRQFISSISDTDIFALFQSVGDDCEFGLMQRAMNVEKLHLLRWASTSPEQLIAVLDRRFEGFADDDKMSFVVGGAHDGADGNEMIMHDHAFGLVGHTWIVQSEENLDLKLENYRRHLNFLKSKMIDDLEFCNYIFMYRHMNVLDADTINRLSAGFSRFGENILFIVSRADGVSNLVGDVRWVGERVLQGFVNERTTPIWIFDEKGEAWSRVCRRAVAIIHDRYPAFAALEDMRARAEKFVKEAYPVNIALNRPATQSSLSRWSVGDTLESDASGAVVGGITGRARFHTNYEFSPWWQVDLGADVLVGEVRIYNRLDQPDVAGRASRLAIEVGAAPEALLEVFRREKVEPFGGVDGHPLIVRFPTPIEARFIRVRLLGTDFLHLDQVEVFGPGDSPGGIKSVAGPSLAVAASPGNGRSDREVMARFQSIGNNCEFGSVQKSLGIGKLSLLQWTASNPQMLIKAVRNDFRDYGDPGAFEVVENAGEYFFRDNQYYLESHSFISVDAMDIDRFKKFIIGRNKFLIRKFIEDIDDGGNIFVYNFFGGGLADMDVLVELAGMLSRHAPNYLLAVGLPGDYCAEQNTVFHQQPGLVLATKDEHTTFNSAPPLYRPGWIKICREALALIERTDPGFWALHEQRVADGRGDEDRVAFAPGNICQGKVATQSSLSAYSIGRTLEEDACGAINGRIDGQAKFHTDMEDSPWWQVDLGAVFGVAAVKIYNRIDVPGVMARASHLAIEIGLEPDHLVEFYRRESDAPFGGFEGEPMVFAPMMPVPGRFVRVRLLRRDYLHLDQVEVFGEALPGFG